MASKLKVDEKQGLKACIDRYRKSVMQATAGSIAAMTPPGRRKGKAYKPTGTTAAQCKAGIRRLKEQNRKKFAPLVGYAAGEYSIYPPQGRSPVHTYIRKKERGRGLRPTKLPIFSSGDDLVDFYTQNTRLDKKCKRRRWLNDGQAWATSASVLKQALKSVNDTVGKFIAGWNALFDYVGKSIKPYTTPSALDIVKAWDESTAVEQGDKISIYNEAQNEPKLEAYAEYIITNDLPATVAYYERTLKRGLEKDLQKALNLDAAGAKELACKIQIQNPFAFEKIKFLISR